MKLPEIVNTRVKAVLRRRSHPSNPTRNRSLGFSRHKYKLRNHIERCSKELKRCQKLATHYVRRDTKLLAFIYLPVDAMDALNVDSA